MKIKFRLCSFIHYVFALIYFLTSNIAIAQNTASVDIISKYICIGESLKLDVGLCGPVGSTYTWKAANGTALTGATPTVTPGLTTIYFCEVNASDGSIIRKTFNVIVIEGISLTVENSLTECMEGRILTFTGTVKGDIPVGTMIKYIFRWGASSTEVREIISDKKTFMTDIKAPSIPLTDVDHQEVTNFKLEIKIGDTRYCNPAEKIITIKQLWINYFRDNLESKDWKVVIGDAIDYSVNATSDCKCDWKLYGLSKNWGLSSAKLTPILGNNLKIPYVNIFTVSLTTGIYTFSGKNEWLGSNNGIVEVSCTDSDGTISKRISTEQSSNLKAKVFFDPVVSFPNGVAPSMGNGPYSNNYYPPLWFLFWKEGEVIKYLKEKNSAGQDLFVWNSLAQAGATSGIPLWGAWVSYSATQPIGYSNIIYLTDDNLSKVNYAIPFKDLDMVNRVRGGGGLYTQCTAETVVHERYHKYVEDTWGVPGSIIVNGFQSDTDGIPDLEEQNPTDSYFPRTSPITSDTYGLMYRPPTLVLINPAYDYSDNEIRCQVLEGKVSSSYPFSYYFPEKDWVRVRFNNNWKN